MGRELIWVAAILVLLWAALAHAEEAAPPPECKPPASDVTANVTIARLQCRLAVLDQDRMREADRATMATAEAAALTLAMMRLQADLAKAREALAAAQAQMKWGFP